MDLKDAKGGSKKTGSKKKKIIITVIVILAVLLVGSRVMGKMKTTADKQAAELNRVTYIPVEAMTVKKQSIASNIMLSGKVEADKEAAVTVSTPGKVTAIHAKVGDQVRKDQVLFSLDKADVMVAYNQASAAYQLAQSAYQTNISNYEISKTNYENVKKLYEIGAVSKTELDQAAIAGSGAVLASYNAQLASAAAAYESAQKTLNDMDVKSPINGTVTALDVKIGSMVTSAVSPAKVVDLQKVFVTVSISEKEINNVQDGQQVQIEVPSASLETKGVINGLSMAANSQGKYTLKTYIENTKGLIKPGMFANVVLSIAKKDNVLVVPTDVIVFHGGKNVVFVVNDKAAVEKEVTIGLESGTESEITKGLAEGDNVICTGQNFVKNGSEIKVVTQDGQAIEESAQAANPDAASSTQTGGGTK